MFITRSATSQLHKPPRVALKILLVFWIYNAKLAVQSIREKELLVEELRKTIKSAIQRGFAFGDWNIELLYSCGWARTIRRWTHGYFGIVIGWWRGRVGVRVTTILGQIRAIFVLSRILGDWYQYLFLSTLLGVQYVCMSVAHLFRTHETEMFYRMRGPWHIIRVTEATNVDIHGSSSFISVWSTPSS